MLTKPNQQLLKLLLNSFRNLKNCDPKWRFKNFEWTFEVRKEIVFTSKFPFNGLFEKVNIQFRQFNTEGPSNKLKTVNFPPPSWFLGSPPYNTVEIGDNQIVPDDVRKSVQGYMERISCNERHPWFNHFVELSFNRSMLSEQDVNWTLFKFIFMMRHEIVHSK